MNMYMYETYCLETCVTSAVHCAISFSLSMCVTILTFDLLLGSA